MKRLFSLALVLLVVPACTGKQIEAAHPVLILGGGDHRAPQADIASYAYWHGECEAYLHDQANFIVCDEQRFKLTVTCEGVPCTTEPVGLLTGGVEMSETDNRFDVRAQAAGTLTLTATMTHAETGEMLTATSTMVIRDPERIELSCSYSHFDATHRWVKEACPTTSGAYDAEGLFEFNVAGVLGDERLVVQPSWTTTGFRQDDTDLTDQSDVSFHPGPPGAHSVHVTYGEFSADYAVVLE